MLHTNIVKIYQDSFREHAKLEALTDYFKEETFTYLEMAEQIAKLHQLFKVCGVERGDKVALIGRNNPRWCISYIATITYGAVIVPILQEFNSSDVHHIINHSESKLLFSGDTLWDTIDIERVTGIKASFSLTDFRCLYAESDKVKQYQDGGAAESEFKSRYPNGFGIEDILYPEVSNDMMLLLNYTSGTTGFSKGVMLTCNNLTGNLQFCLDAKIRLRGSRVLAFLPLAHAYGCMVDLLLSLAEGAHVYLLGKIPSPKLLIEAMQRVKPQVICCVPLILEKICRRQIFPQLGKGFVRIAIKLPLIDSKIYAKIRQELLNVFGGEVEQFVIGGAPLNDEVEEFLVKIKFPFSVGYGLTECAPLVSFTGHKEYKPTSCGMVMHGYMEAKIDSPEPSTVPGEIILRGENVMRGYYKDKKATEEVLGSDGWLKTGDIGTMDEDGTLYIHGRNKSMILGSNGQNIYPEGIESKLNNLPFVNESLVVERDGKLVALVYPDYEQVDLNIDDSAELNGEMKDRFTREMAKNLAELNQSVAAFERVSEIILYPTEFEKTPKKSIKRYLYSR